MEGRRSVRRQRMEDKKGRVKKDREESYVPGDIARDILLRLPVKSLVRFNSVCKNWRNMISDPGFEDINFQQRISEIPIVFRARYHVQPTKLVLKLEGTGTRAREVTSLSFKSRYKSVDATTLCNGFLILRYKPYNRRRQCRLYLYDTVTHQQKILPKIPELDDDSPLDNIGNISSLMFDSSGKRYKVVVFHCDYFSRRLIMCYIYSLNLQNWRKREKWRKLKPQRSQELSVYDFTSIAVNGIFYWIAQPEPFLQPMNIATEEFMEIIQLPCQPRYCSLLIKKGSLCLINASNDDELEIWILKDTVQSIWINQYKISLASILNRPSTLSTLIVSFKPILVAESCNSNTTYILVEHWGNCYWYNINTQEMRLIDVGLNKGPYSFCYVPIVQVGEAGST